MKECPTIDIRNIALVGHGAAGKTMLAESMLACSGTLTRLGRIMQGNTASDFFEEEQKHQHSIYTSLLSFNWQNKKFNVLDTPGYADFIGETLAALRVADLAAVVVHGEHGVELGTQTVWNYANTYKLPRILILNALDKENVDFEEQLKNLKSIFGSRIVPFTLPMATGPGFNQILDVLHHKVITYKGDELGGCTQCDAIGELAIRAQKLHYELVECVAESDDALLEKFFEQGNLPEDILLNALPNAIRKQSVIPLFATSGEKNVGVAPLLDFFAQFGPHPLENETYKEITAKTPTLFIFKTINEAKSGGLSLFRVAAGTVKPGLNLYNNARRSTERIGQLFSVNGKNRLQLELFNTGDLGAAAKLKDTHTNNTLSDSNTPIIIAPTVYPTSNMSVAIRCRSKDDDEKLSIGLHTVCEEDQTFTFKVDPELHQIIISGQGELHLETCVEKLRNRFGLEVESYQPRIAYRETIKMKGDAKYRHKKQSGGAGQFAEVWMRIEPKSHDEDVEFTQSLVGQNVDRVFVPSVEKGVRTACTKGALAGYKVVGVKVDFYDGKQHPVDSKDIAFQIAGKHAFKEAFLQAKPCLLEPIMLVAIKVPDEFTGDIMSDISSRRGKILGIESETNYTVIKAHVPQAELYRYATNLRSMVGGKGMHTEAFDHYEEMPHELETKVIASHKADAEEVET
jgi:elongation factor G